MDEWTWKEINNLAAAINDISERLTKIEQDLHTDLEEKEEIVAEGGTQ